MVTFNSDLGFCLEIKTLRFFLEADMYVKQFH